jgi:hypothetical protein
MSTVTKYRKAFYKLKKETKGVISFERIIKETGGKGKSAIKRGRSREFDELHDEITTYNKNERGKIKKKDKIISNKNKKIKELESIVNSLTNQNLMLLDSIENIEKQKRKKLSIV